MFPGILSILDSRSFSSVWFWLILVLVWSMAGRRVLGVPVDVVNAARKPRDAGDDPAALLLLDWLSLTLPRWRMARSEGIVLLGLSTFALSCLFLLGFVYGLEMAQALVLLIVPFPVLFTLELLLSRRVAAVVGSAASGSLPVNQAAAQAAGMMRQHRLVVTIVSVVFVALTAWRAALWLVAHPFGF